MKSYIGVLRSPGAWRFLIPALVARLPFAMLQIGILLLVQWATGSYGAAGLASAAAAIAQAVVGPQTGRLADRHGQARVLIPQVALHAGALGTLLLLAAHGASLLPLTVFSALAGASMPQVSSMVRARWSHLLQGSGRLGAAFALESITDELTFTLAPVLLVAVSTVFSPVWALALALLLVLAGTLVFARVRVGAPTPAPASSRASGVLRLRGVALLAGGAAAIGTVFGATQVGVTSFTAALGQPGSAGAIYGTFSAASMVGGIVYGARKWRWSPSRRLVLLLALLVFAAALPSVAATAPPALTYGFMYAAVALAGLVIAPAVITAYTMVERLVGAEARTEAYTWLGGAIGLGIATGAAIAGRLTDAFGPAAAFLVPPAAVGAAALVLLLRSASLTPIERPGSSNPPDERPAQKALDAQDIVLPPLTASRCPVMNRAPGEARNATASATSIGTPM
ncbi:MFS transporter [Streptosporangiaceae bacterium NEAU-GS5]|nr:MFS transporter [Streptosporangiaceae bacterium NEAU-GS5]